MTFFFLAIQKQKSKHAEKIDQCTYSRRIVLENKYHAVIIMMSRILNTIAVLIRLGLFGLERQVSHVCYFLLLSGSVEKSALPHARVRNGTIKSITMILYDIIPPIMYCQRTFYYDRIYYSDHQQRQ